MLDYAIKLSRTPSAVTSDDVERLRGAGFEDAAILDICQVTFYYNYVNRLADGLGVELESSWRNEDLSISREQFQQARKHRP
jgi:alkylhydroperoxidase family enzyme